jgi:hypothetical protein
VIFHLMMPLVVLFLLHSNSLSLALASVMTDVCVRFLLHSDSLSLALASVMTDVHSVLLKALVLHILTGYSSGPVLRHLST